MRISKTEKKIKINFLIKFKKKKKRNKIPLRALRKQKNSFSDWIPSKRVHLNQTLKMQRMTSKLALKKGNHFKDK
jgi:hypothetical protein